MRTTPSRSVNPPEPRPSATRCDCGCHEVLSIGDEIYVTHDGERVKTSHFDEYAYLALVARKERVER